MEQLTKENGEGQPIQPEAKKLSAAERRKQRILANDSNRMGFITGECSEIKEKPIEEVKPEADHIEQAPTESLNTPTTEEGPISKKLFNVGIGFMLIFFIGTFAHFSGYSLLHSEFAEGFLCCLFMFIGIVALLIRKLILFAPALVSQFPQNN
ncbi:hypothetical protein EIN_153170 [Entamoeba invadens IP1]|uniref:Uncharacterized protein n=1 Tax=Entamoeba invadens IP1 TaxID=370355 RepID=A0A0A1U8R1_ENTIV|nr:hypothetical protein EIN_153170 [Entamoeba invadens IP1]ELP91310.1 hypothetical protein EIN_153170 [Entamoeba invadens IP1]|eukprot:XP_004258081.1 hypothetical protein EIN_153170 [Entamoeba invadens IP1]